MVSFCLQSLCFPSFDLCSEQELYFRLHGPATFSERSNHLDLRRGSTAIFDTYFNLFNIGKWVKHAKLKSLHLEICGSGTIAVSVFQASKKRSWIRLITDKFSLSPQEEIEINLSHFKSDWPNGILFIEVKALTDATLSKVDWTTSDTPRRTPKTCAVLTTFDRPTEVSNAVNRLFRSKEILSCANINLVVVNNGKELPAYFPKGVLVLKNKNLGGSGGFARGWIHAQEHNFTHCIFMDDDALVHVESLLRIQAFFAFAVSSKVSVSGALTDAIHTWSLHENGAEFDGLCRGLNRGLDLRDSKAVIDMEWSNSPQTKNSYGAWWLLAFPMAGVRYGPFPFFVRGDDISFALSNQMDIMTLNGVISFQDEGFEHKLSPWTLYLDLRSHLAHLTYFDFNGFGFFAAFKTALFFPMRSLMAHQYDSAKAMILAIQHVMDGPEIFDQDTRTFRQSISNFSRTETWSNKSTQKPKPSVGTANRFTRFLCKASCNGLFIPFFHTFGSKIRVNVSDRVNLRLLWGASTIEIVDQNETHVMTVGHSKWTSLKLLGQLCLVLLKFAFKFQRSKAEWQRNYPKMTSKSYWENRLEITLLDHEHTEGSR